MSKIKTSKTVNSVEANSLVGTIEKSNINTASTPIRLTFENHLSINDILKNRLQNEPDTIMFERKNSDGQWSKVTVKEFCEQVDEVAKGLVATGLLPGDKLGILSRTRYEWTLLDFAAWRAGLVVVPIYETSSIDQIAWILEDAGVNVLITETEELLNSAKEARNKIEGYSRCHIIMSIDGENPAISALTKLGEEFTTEELDKISDTVNLDSVATLIYTSGTTGRPKGAILTHGNFLTLALNTVDLIPEVFNGQGKAVLFLPLAHVFARFIQIVAIAGSTVLAHSADISNLTKDLAAVRPTYLLGVPRIFEKVYNAAENSSAQDKARGYFNWATKIAIAYSRALDTPKGPNLYLKWRRLWADGLVFSKLRDRLGGRVEFAVSGGGPLGERLGHFYRGIGLKILEGYGLTESSAPISVNLPNNTKIGSVGKALPGSSIKIAEDGEILLKGIGVFQGYLNNSSATEDTFDADGWFKTGDLGYLDNDGFLFINGRKKEILVSAGGKNLNPNILEDRARAHALISQCVVVGDNKPFFAALVSLDPEGLPGWLTMHNKPSMTMEEAMNDEDVKQSIQKAIERANEAVSHAEAIKKWDFLPFDLTVENGYLTPSLKVKRHIVTKDFTKEIETLYIDTRESK